MFAVSSMKRSPMVPFHTPSANPPLPDRCRLVLPASASALTTCSAVVPSRVGIELRELALVDFSREIAISACEARWPRQSTSILAASLSIFRSPCSMSAPSAVSLTTGVPGDAADPAARVQRAARALGQQAEIVGVETEGEIERAARIRRVHRSRDWWCPREIAARRRSSPRPA